MEVDLQSFRSRVADLSASDLPPHEERYTAFRTVDPFPDIPPALLNAGHVATYAVATGMIEPFDITKLVKPATYLVPLMGPCRYLDENGEQQKFYLANTRDHGTSELRVESEFDLKPNSICYVTLQPHFRMPSYIAGRFNLLIRDVYRGLLVGTGPLVDPGFDGYISIPIHNFTTNTYPIRAGENFVYFEFTKLSWSNPPGTLSLPAWCPRAFNDQPPFPADKNQRKTLDDYLHRATNDGKPAQNAIGEYINDIRKSNKATRHRLRFFTVAGHVAIAVLLLQTLSVLWITWQSIHSMRSEQGTADARLTREINELRTELELLKYRLQEAATLQVDDDDARPANFDDPMEAPQPE